MLGVVSDFAENHDIEFGYDKTRAVLFRPEARQRIPAPVLRLRRMSGLRVDDPRVPYEREAAYLGVLFTDTLSWVPHIRRLLASVTRMVSALKSTVLRPDCLPPSMALDTVRTLLLSKATCGVAVWGPSVFWPASYRRACPWAASSLGDIDRAFTDCLRAALALPHYTATAAVWREAGWFGFSHAAAVKLLAMLNSVNRLPPRHAMRLTLQEACTHLSADPSDRGDSGAYMSWVPLPFVLHARALGDSLGLRAVVDAALTGVLCPWPKHELRHVRDGPLRKAMTAHCESRLRTHTCASHYPAEAPWEMSADLAYVRASDLSLAYLTVVKVRANANVLGSTVVRMSQQGGGGPAHCPACGMPEADDPDHAFSRCRHPGMASLRARFLPVVSGPATGDPTIHGGARCPAPASVSQLLYRGRLRREAPPRDDRWNAGIKSVHRSGALRRATTDPSPHEPSPYTTGDLPWSLGMDDHGPLWARPGLLLPKHGPRPRILTLHVHARSVKLPPPTGILVAGLPKMGGHASPLFIPHPLSQSPWHLRPGLALLSPGTFALDIAAQARPTLSLVTAGPALRPGHPVMPLLPPLLAGPGAAGGGCGSRMRPQRPAGREARAGAQADVEFFPIGPQTRA